MSTTIHNLSALQLGSEVNIFTAAAIREQILHGIAQSPRFEIDLSLVDELDTAGIQLLLATKKECQSRGGDLTLINHSAKVLEIFDLCNLTHYFGDPVVIESL